jgi:type I protein arginine methyltransferase
VEYYFKRYGDLELQRRMVADRPRTDAFAAAIREVVRPTDVVLDVGTGTGILAMLAARAGARKVYAVDQSDIADAAARLVVENRLDDRVEVIKGGAADLQLPEKVDLLISEWLGHVAFVEGMLPDVLSARNRNLAEGGRMLPAHVAVLLAPIDDPVLYSVEGPGFWREPVHGVDFSMLEEAELAQGRALQIRVDRSTLLAPAQKIIDIELDTCTADDSFGHATASYLAKRDGVLNGFVAWFDAQLSPSVMLSTAPGNDTHWAQTYFAFPPQLVRKGETIDVEWKLQEHEEEMRYLSLTIRARGREQIYTLE